MTEPTTNETPADGQILDPTRRRALKAQAHALSPVVLLGNAGLTDAVAAEIDRALSSHELIKVRASGADREARRLMAGAITDRLGCAIVQIIGNVIVLYRHNPDLATETAGRTTRTAAAPRGARADDAHDAGDRGSRRTSKDGSRRDVPLNRDGVVPSQRISRRKLASIAASVTPRGGSFLVPETRAKPAASNSRTTTPSDRRRPTTHGAKSGQGRQPGQGNGRGGPGAGGRAGTGAKRSAARPAGGAPRSRPRSRSGR